MTNAQLVSAVNAIGELAQIKLPGRLAIQVYRLKARLLDEYKILREANANLVNMDASGEDIAELFNQPCEAEFPLVTARLSDFEAAEVTPDSIGMLEYLGLLSLEESGE